MMRKKSTKDWRIPIEAILKYKATAGEKARCAAIRKAIMMHSGELIPTCSTSPATALLMAITTDILRRTTCC